MKTWLPAFIVVFLYYQAPEGIGIRWLNMPALASAIMLSFLAFAWIVARGLGGPMGKSFALEVNRSSMTWLATGLLLAMVAKTIAICIGLQLGVYAPEAGRSEVAVWPLLMGFAWLALSTFVPSLAEDIVTRGFWARIPAWPWTGLRFVLFTTIAYVFNHIYRLGNGPTEWLMLFCFGLAYGAAFWRTGSLWAAVGLHWGWNFAGPAIDAVFPVTTQAVELSRLTSAAAHLAILGVVLACYPSRGIQAQTFEKPASPSAQ